jgi:hypothetical protein
MSPNTLQDILEEALEVKFTHNFSG